MRRLTFLAILAAIVLASAAAYLYVDLRRTNEDLRATETTLATTDSLLRERTAALKETTAVLAQTRSVFVAERTVRNQLQLDKSSLQADKETLTASLHTAAVTNATLTADLAAAASLQLALRMDLENAVDVQKVLHMELASSQAQAVALQLEKATLEGQHQRLQMTAGTIGELETKTRDLQAEIAELEDRRRPLVLALDTSARSGFLCTGSMEPTITCLDEATWLRDFRPEDIAIGATIAFKPNCWEDDEDARGAAHRVMDIRVEEGIHYYWPRGDGAREPDGCWVPHTNVRGYIIEIHKDVRPANAELRERVNAAKATYYTARTALDAAQAAYLDLVESYCGHRIPAQCRLSPGPHAQATAAYNKYLRVREYYLATANLWECWNRNALDSAYPGHIPYLCGPPPPPV